MKSQPAAAMNVIKLSDIDILDVGNTIQIAGAIWSGNGKIFVAPLPDEPLEGELIMLRMMPHEWERFLNQSDVLDVRGPGKAILRKGQRQIDQHVSWFVYERDDFRCRYCGRRGPLTVDHIILWEEGGATIADNLLTACRRCNKVRGSMEYKVWMGSQDYNRFASDLAPEVYARNMEVVSKLDQLERIKAKPRSR